MLLEIYLLKKKNLLNYNQITSNLNLLLLLCGQNLRGSGRQAGHQLQKVQRYNPLLEHDIVSSSSKPFHE